MIEEGYHIQPIFPIWSLIAGFLALLAFFWWKEFRRQMGFLFWRLAATLLMLLALLGLLLQPSRQKENKSDGTALLTPHYLPAYADSLRRANPQLTFLRTRDAAPYPEAKVLAAYEDALDGGTNVRFVLGDGLPPSVLPMFDTHFHYLPGEWPAGITEWVQPATFNVNQRAEIGGTFRAKGNSTIKLISPGGAEDSVSFEAGKTQVFNLSLTPRQAGLFIYQLSVEDSAGAVRTHSFPVEVLADKKLSILFLQSYPTAEVRYLKNFLIEKGHSLAVRAQLSRNNFRYEYAHRPALPLNRLSADLLTAFDVVLMDSESLELLAASEREALEEAVKSGLGVVMLYNSSGRKKSASFLSLPLQEFRSDTARVRLGTASFTLATLPAVVESSGVEPITRGGRRVLSGYLNKGAGKVAFQLLQETYQLVLEGKSAPYAILWSPLLERAARAQNAAFQIQVREPFPYYTDEPLAVNVLAAQPAPRLTSDGVSLPLREDAVIDDYWHGTTWASEPGWHRLAIEQDSTAKNYYVSESTEWQSLRRAQQRRANEIISQSVGASVNQVVTSTERQLVSPFLFFLIFLLAAGFLWLVPKL